MPADIGQLRPHLQSFDLTALMVDGLGWNHPETSPIPIKLAEGDFTLQPLAEKAGFVVYLCAFEHVPTYPVRRKIERRAARVTFEHMIVFTDNRHSLQKWQWIKREEGVSDACHEIEYRDGQRGDPLLQQLRGLQFTLEEEERMHISYVTDIVKKAMDVEKVTKRFYEHFKRELTAFQDFIGGIAAQGDKEWYASLMLNRMMFIYFVQKQGFLDGDPDYLRNRLERVRTTSGRGRFQQFYRLFLLRLFHEGLAKPESDRAQDLAELLGRVPYLNGGLFDIHDLERNNQKISIPDEAFEKIFKFFDQYKWTLDWRPNQKDDEINPDVLGYIFEKYINQKQMGAYYTKEDITGYIARNTVIPFLFDAAKKECPVAFIPNGGVWGLLRDDPDQYIYPALGHGITWDVQQTPHRRLEKQCELPEEIAAGINDVSERGRWNETASSKCALPTETWREVVARRQRYHEVKSKLASGEIQDINDLITLNLNVEQFAKDVIVQSEGPELLRAFWHAISSASILDPTCGSGAFLFAALNVVEPLYIACLEGMRGFLDDLERSKRRRRSEALKDFQSVLREVEEHPNHQYYVLKSIVIKNLYGVDIMEEAVEICKLRLFLKLMAQLKSSDQIEPLPDIDFNIRAGNTLVGFTSLDAVQKAMQMAADGQSRLMTEKDLKTLEDINKDAETSNRIFEKFRSLQTTPDVKALQEGKAELRSQLGMLRSKLDRYLAAEYGINPKNAKAYDLWRSSHQPFHWFVEFYGIMKEGGFDVVVGNPPYVEYGKVKGDYTVKGYGTEPCGNLYAFVIERNEELCLKAGRTSMIVPHSAICTDRMDKVQEILNKNVTWVSTYDIRPAKLFDGVDQRLCVYVMLMKDPQQTVFSTRYHRWHEGARPILFHDLEYVDSTSFRFHNSVPKIQSVLETKIVERLNVLEPLGVFLHRRERAIYYHNAPRYWIRCTDFAPYFWNERDGEQLSTQVKILKFKNRADAQAVVAVLNSSLFYWWFILLSDCRHLNMREIESFPIGLEQMPQSTKAKLAKASARLMVSFRQCSRRKETQYKATGRVVYDEFDQKPSKLIVDEIDQILSEHYKLTEEELDFIINYDIKYRMG